MTPGYGVWKLHQKNISTLTPQKTGPVKYHLNIIQDASPPRTIRFLVGNPKLNFHLLRLHPRWGHRSNPIESVYGVYLRTFTIKNLPNAGKYKPYMDRSYGYGLRVKKFMEVVLETDQSA